MDARTDAITNTSERLKSTAPQNSGRVYWRGMEHRGLWAHRYADQVPVARRRASRLPAAAEPDAPRCQLPCLSVAVVTVKLTVASCVFFDLLRWCWGRAEFGVGVKARAQPDRAAAVGP